MKQMLKLRHLLRLRDQQKDFKDIEDIGESMSESKSFTISGSQDNADVADIVEMEN